MKTIYIGGKVSDCSNFHITNEDDRIIKDGEGYVPYDICCGGGDYLEFEIDIETGRIIGWNAELVKKTLKEIVES